ncbi:glutamine--fructose-6-phosphate transaminase (isomerizing) [Candidatus Woesearchaeota archaeon]|nr:glutamine--fructose-6-phosphate transaminase (isomerizing) [Candidatus Woesearchaeota archaeon]
MCGIIGIVSKKSFSVKNDLLKGLKKLEYRGYDSCGFATKEGAVEKSVGEIQLLIDSVKDSTTTLGIGHSRWATHGGVTKANAHPHFNKDKTLFAVHNGIIENYQELKQMLEKNGYGFMSETDSEVIPHYFDYYIKKGLGIKDIMIKFMAEVKGTFAILLFRKEDGRVYAMKRDSPLVLGVCDDCFVLASDIYAFSDKTNKALFFDDNEFAIISSDYHFYNGNGKEIKKKIQNFEWSREEETKKNFEHFMLKEVHEQPAASRRLIESLKLMQKDALKSFAEAIKKSKRIFFLACGTSYHASLIGVYLLRKLGIEAHTVIASEFENFLAVDKDTLVVAISQSGETMDVVSVLKDIKKTGAKIISIVNVPYSTIQRLSDFSIEVLAGQEICVAATKSFTNQIVVMLAIAKELGFLINLDEIPGKIKKALEDNEEKVRKLALGLKDKKDIFVLGRGISYPIAREIALKLKEISYVHAEGMMGGELKHGTIALIEKGTPVISLIPNHNEDMISNTKEVEARGARTIIVSDTNGDLIVPKSHDAEFSIYACMIGHLLSYYIAKENKLPIDKPRNLAKSVTVK